MLSVISDQWRAYNTIANHGFTHLNVNHSKNFVDPDTGAHTQTIERLWESAKKRNKEQCGTRQEMLDSYFCEFLWRQDVKRREVEPFHEILDNIAQYMPPE
ncbi:MAG TPA: transposase [Puia sp.]|nr:transposase [Puia sp.]